MRSNVHIPSAPMIVVRDGAKTEGRRVYYCQACLTTGRETVFYEGEEVAWRRHVIACAERNEQDLQEHSMRVKAPYLFDPAVAGDVDLYNYVQRHGREIMEGRKKL